MEKPKEKSKRELTDQQRLFVSCYVDCLNETEAYLASHPSCKKRSTAANNGSRALRNAYIRAAVNAGLKEKGMGAEEVLARLAEQGRVNISEFISEKGLNWDNVKKYGHLIKSIKWTRYGPKIELYDGQAAQVHIGKHLKLFKDELELPPGGIVLNVVYQDKPKTNDNDGL
jgi:hypothetical protein